ncbi:phospholipase D family protein [Acrocarpospora sp. B8E8]|uniref:phospholipase D family protein n=1 Tax=Acrocarpospora sp. B8E8 TaxID=3153572 RepID=UPI00325E131B
MTNDYIWRQIEALLANAADKAILMAPFIKKDVFQALLGAIPSTVAIQCVTRWSVAEIAAGVSDPEIAEIAAADGRASIMLCHHLHAKLYVADDRCLVGSANLTGKATGRVQPANMELLLEVPTSHPEVQRLIKAVTASAVAGTIALARQVREQADLLVSDEESPQILVPGEYERSTRWMPETRRPARLYGVYRGRHESINIDILAGIIRDLANLDIPPGLDENAFSLAVLSRLHEMPEIRQLLTVGRLNMGELQQELADSGDYTVDQARRSVETLAEWLRYFDQVHVVPLGPWEIRQGREIGD